MLGRSYGVAYWHKHFPDWPLKIRCCTAPCDQQLPMLWLCVVLFDLVCLIVSRCAPVARMWGVQWVYDPLAQNAPSRLLCITGKQT